MENKHSADQSKHHQSSAIYKVRESLFYWPENVMKFHLLNCVKRINKTIVLARCHLISAIFTRALKGSQLSLSLVFPRGADGQFICVNKPTSKVASSWRRSQTKTNYNVSITAPSVHRV